MEMFLIFCLAYLVIAVLMVPVGLLPFMLWPMFKFVQDHEPEALIPMKFRRFQSADISRETLVPVFLVSPVIFICGLLVWMTYGLLKVAVVGWYKLCRAFGFFARTDTSIP